MKKINPIKKVNKTNAADTKKTKRNRPQTTLSVKIRSTIMWVLLCSVMPLYNVIAYLAYLLPAKSRHYLVSSWGILFLFLTKHICKTKYQVLGLENLIKGPAILASNHQSTWETLAFNKFFPPHVWIAKKELLKIPFFGWAFRTVSPIAIDRKAPTAASKQIVQQGKQRIKKGFWILVYPEGTRVTSNSKDHPYKAGAARMALELNLPIIPIAHNAGHIMPRSSFWVYPGLVTVRIGKPIYINKGDDGESLTARIKASITHELDLINQQNK
jgi:1-acyl-sn-glycerol-3-phosphate acyltransferase